MTDQTNLDVIADEIVRIDEQVSSLKDKDDGLKALVASMVGEEPGEYELRGSSHVIKVRIDERMKWDQEILCDLHRQGALPPEVEVEMKFKIPKKLWRAMGPNERAIVEPALTVEPGAKRITVEKV